MRAPSNGTSHLLLSGLGLFRKMLARGTCRTNENNGMNEFTHGGAIAFLRLWKREGERSAGQWNGDEPRGEEDAMLGKKISEKCDELLKGHEELQVLIELL